MQRRVFFPLILILIMVTAQVQSQRLIASKPAHLQIFGKFLDGTEVTAETRSLMVTYDIGLVRGELPLSSLSAMDMRVLDYLDKINLEKILFEVMVPEGAFSFGKTIEERFQSEGEIIVDHRRTKFIMNFLVTNRATKGSNTFQLVCSAELSLAEHFNLTEIEDMDDRLSFQYSQNMEMKMQ